MSAWIAKLGLNQKLAALALLLGLGAVIAGDPYRGARVTVDAEELGLIVQKEVDHVSVDDLAAWIIRGQADYRLVDLRGAAEFAEYHIPGAENIPLTALSSGKLGRNEKIVLYSDGGIHSAQAWMLLRVQGFVGVYILRGGLDEWKDRILFPRLASSATPAETAAFERARQLSKFFGGRPQTGTTEEQTAPNLDLPKLPAIAPSVSPSGGSAPRKRKEGC